MANSRRKDAASGYGTREDSDGNDGGSAGRSVSSEVGGSTSRLSSLKRPRTSAHSKQNRKLITTGDAPIPNRLRKLRNAGKLSNLMDMPLDVFFEITAKLSPLDLLQLSRVSKQFRATFMCPSTSKHIWVASRRNIPDLPDCPPDLNEAQYACLIFERSCHACGIPRANKVDFVLRVRFCGPCFQENVKKGTALARALSHYDIPDIVYTLLPRSMLKLAVAQNGSTAFDNTSNTKYNAYYSPELEMVATQYEALQHNQTSLDQFVKEQQAMALQMMQHGQILNSWDVSRRQNRAAQDHERTLSREASIEKRLLELGWDREFFSVSWDLEWAALVRQPRELTPRIWNAIRPKLEVILERNKQESLQRKFDSRLLMRKSEFRPIWDSFLGGISSAQDRGTMPTFADACELPSIRGMLVEEWGTMVVTEERWFATIESALPEMEEHKAKVQSDLMAILNGSTENPGLEHFHSAFGESRTGSDSPGQLPDVAIFSDCVNGPVEKHDNAFEIASRSTGGPSRVLKDPLSLFTCSLSPCGRLFRFPRLLEHEHISNPEKHWSPGALKFEPEVPDTVMRVLEALALEENMSRDGLDELDGMLLCSCGHPKFGTPMDFLALIRHIVDENKWYTKVEASARQRNAEVGGVLINNDHDLKDVRSFVRVVTPSDLLAREPESDFGNSYKYCKLCYQAYNRAVTPLVSDEIAAYHMKAKHLRKLGEGDAVIYRDLVRTPSSSLAGWAG